MPKQKLSPKAAAAKKKRDLAYAKTSERKKKKAHAQRMRRKAGSKANGKDWDHKDGKFKPVKANRGNGGKERSVKAGKNISSKRTRRNKD
jgi:hypothetical protein